MATDQTAFTQDEWLASHAYEVLHFLYSQPCASRLPWERICAYDERMMK